MIDDIFQLPFRVLEEKFENDTVSVLECGDINVSWQPIYLALFLTFFQIAIFLSIFEWGRRNKYVESVYDKRRSRYSARTPAPLMKQRGFRIRLLQFEWWKIHITDADYQKQSWDEFRRLKMEAEAKNWKESQQRLAGEEFDPFITAAENQCYRESPFFPLLNDIESQKFGYGDKPTPTRNKNEDYSEYKPDTVSNDYDYDYGYGNQSQSSLQPASDEPDSFGLFQWNGHGYNAEQYSQTARQSNTQLTETTAGTNGTDCGFDAPCVDANDNDYGYDDDNWKSDTPSVAFDTSSNYDIDVSQSSFQEAIETSEYSVTSSNRGSDMSASYADLNRMYLDTGGESQAKRTLVEQSTKGHTTPNFPAPHSVDVYSPDTLSKHVKGSPSLANSSGDVGKNEETPRFSLDDILGNIKPSTPLTPPTFDPFEPKNNFVSTREDTNNAMKGNSLTELLPSQSSASDSTVDQTKRKRRTPFRKRTLSQEERVAEQIKLSEEIRRVDEKLEKLRKDKKEREVAEAKGRLKVALVSSEARDTHESQLVKYSECDLTTDNGRDSNVGHVFADANAIRAPTSFNLDSVLGNLGASLKKQDRKILTDEELGTIMDNHSIVSGYECNKDDFTGGVVNKSEGVTSNGSSNAFSTHESKSDDGDILEGGIDEPFDSEFTSPRTSDRNGETSLPAIDVSPAIYGFNTESARPEKPKVEAENADLDYGYESAKNNDEEDYGYAPAAENDNEYGYGYAPDHEANANDYEVEVEDDYRHRQSSTVPMKSDERPSNLNRIRRHTGASNDVSNPDPPGEHALSKSRHGLVQRGTGLKNTSDHAPNRRSSGQYNPNRRNTQEHLSLEQEKNRALGSRRSIAKRLSSSVGSFLKRRVLMIDDDISENDSGENKAASAYVASKVSRRLLTEENQELLRCVGLDSFVTLRFLQFGFDVSFWPMIVSLFTLIPLYKSGEETCVGFFTTTVVNVENDSWRFWIILLFGWMQMLYILRRLWIEWEIFLPLRYEFLHHGDFEKEKYSEQYRKTCIVEYIPRHQKNDKGIYEFMDAIFPSQVQRAEILLNTEFLTDLIKSRMHHIVRYEEVYAGKVHRRAAFLRQTAAYQAGEKAKKCCRSFKILKAPSEPSEPTIYARENQESTTKKVVALKWHYDNITRLNKEIEVEYLRLAQAQKRPVVNQKESRLAKWLGIKYLTGSDTGRLHSSTAFVEFKTMAAKQHAVQCNITGMNNCMVVTPVPEVRDLIWDNMHVSRALIDTRKAVANIVLAAGLVLWSIIVSSIRNFQQLSKYLETAITKDPAVVSFLDFYAPALIVEGLVRAIPNIIKVGVIVVRFKARSERDHYVLGWYFYFRLVTFVFIIVSDTIVDSSTSFVENPIDFFQDISKKVALNSQFFITYVIVSGGVQVFFRLSQLHNLALHWILTNVKREEALAQRKIDALKSNMKTFHLDAFIPLFIFIFMVSALYGAIAPLSGFFVAVFFKLSFKVFKFMTLYIYGGDYEGGGFLFYTISNIIFYVLYMIIAVIGAYIAVNGGGEIGVLYLLLLGVVFFVQRDVERTFVIPSKMLSLAKARVFDEKQDTRSWKEKTKDAFLKAKKAYKNAEKDEKALGHSDHFDAQAQNLMRPLHYRTDSSKSLGSDSNHVSVTAPRRGRKKGCVETQTGDAALSAVEMFNKRYTDENAFDTEDEDGNPKAAPGTDFFIYRQPTLNKTTWETQPKAYRDGLEREEAPEVWGDKRPEQVRQTARARRASIAMCYGG